MSGTMRPNNRFLNGYPGQVMQPNFIGQAWNPPSEFRQQTYPYYPQVAANGWMNLQQYPYPSQVAQPFFQNHQPGFGTPYVGMSGQPYTQKDSQFLFQNPLQPKEESYSQPYMQMNGYGIMNPYPKQSFIPKQPSGVQSLMNSFKSQDGSIDFNKMINTAGQMVNAVSQVSSLVKGFGGMFKV
ncbi:YppG family protein [Neobacillus dielmonensis]|uniref:YppG family protein n=1 Tax=Neobacillus dielmonensis TaxID=1347369 RepID=UPI000A5E4673|nr:YppG family protein [Neobacillus dielmonensis]